MSSVHTTGGAVSESEAKWHDFNRALSEHEYTDFEFIVPSTYVELITANDS